MNHSVQPIGRSVALRGLATVLLLVVAVTAILTGCQAARSPGQSHCEDNGGTWDGITCHYGPTPGPQAAWQSLRAHASQRTADWDTLDEWMLNAYDLGDFQGVDDPASRLAAESRAELTYLDQMRTSVAPCFSLAFNDWYSFTVDQRDEADLAGLDLWDKAQVKRTAAVKAGQAFMTHADLADRNCP